MFNTTKTIYSMILDNANILNYKYQVLPNTTLNEKFNITTNIEDDIENPSIRYFGIGLDYEDMIEDSNVNIDNIRHEPHHSSLFKHAPMIARKASIGFTSDEYNKYRLLVRKNINGEDYLFFMLKKIDNIFDSNKILLVESEDNESTISVFSTDRTDILNPVPKERDDVLDSKIDYLAYSNHIFLNLDENELSELRDASKLYYGTDDEITLGEVSLVSGIELFYEGREEAFNTQTMYFIKINHLLDDNNIQEPFRKSVDIGGMSPMVFRTYKND